MYLKRIFLKRIVKTFPCPSFWLFKSVYRDQRYQPLAPHISSQQKRTFGLLLKGPLPPPSFLLPFDYGTVCHYPARRTIKTVSHQASTQVRISRWFYPCLDDCGPPWWPHLAVPSRRLWRSIQGGESSLPFSVLWEALSTGNRLLLPKAD